MPENDKLKKLHKQLSNDFSDIPEYPTFVEAIKDKTRLQQLHGVLKQKYSDTPDFNIFTRNILEEPYNPAATTTDPWEVYNSATPIKVTDTRTLDMASGVQIGDKNNLSFKVNPLVAQQIIKQAKEKGIDPYTALAVAYQETGISNHDQQNGRVENNPFHVWEPDSEGFGDNFKTPEGTIGSSLDTLKQKLLTGSKKSKDEAAQIQAYNGYGTIKLGHDDLEGAKKVYGVSISPEGLNMSNNPLYGKRVIDIRENILKKNRYITSLVEGK